MVTDELCLRWLVIHVYFRTYLLSVREVQFCPVVIQNINQFIYSLAEVGLMLALSYQSNILELECDSSRFLINVYNRVDSNVGNSLREAGSTPLPFMVNGCRLVRSHRLQPTGYSSFSYTRNKNLPSLPVVKSCIFLAVIKQRHGAYHSLFQCAVFL